MDVGGTTAKISVLRNGEPIYRKPSDLFGNPIEVSLPFLRSIALGGGSVVKPQSGSQPPVSSTRPRRHGLVPRSSFRTASAVIKPRSPTHSSPQESSIPNIF